MKLGRLFLRLVVGGYFFGHGTQKLFGWFDGHGLDATAGMFESLGLRPGKRHATAAGLAEAGGGAALLLGAASPLPSSVLIATMITAIHRVHLANGPWVTGTNIAFLDWQGAADYVQISQRHEFAVTYMVGYKLAPGINLAAEYLYIQKHQGGFLAHLGFRHFVQWFDRHPGVFGAIFHPHDAPAGFQSAQDGLHHFVRMIELVINIDHQHDINGIGRQTGVGDRA